MNTNLLYALDPKTGKTIVIEGDQPEADALVECASYSLTATLDDITPDAPVQPEMAPEYQSPVIPTPTTVSISGRNVDDIRKMMNFIETMRDEPEHFEPREVDYDGFSQPMRVNDFETFGDVEYEDEPVEVDMDEYEFEVDPDAEEYDDEDDYARFRELAGLQMEAMEVKPAKKSHVDKYGFEFDEDDALEEDHDEHPDDCECDVCVELHESVDYVLGTEKSKALDYEQDANPTKYSHLKPKNAVRYTGKYADNAMADEEDEVKEMMEAYRRFIRDAE